MEFAAHSSTPACGVSIGKPVSGDFDAQITLQRHFYTAGLAAYIKLERIMEWIVLSLLLMQSVLVWRMLLCGVSAWAVWWGLTQAFHIGPSWLSWVPYLVGIFGGALWYWRAPPPRMVPRPSAPLTSRSASLGALLCWVVAIALCYSITQGADNPLVLPGAIFFGAFGALCTWRGAQELRAARGTSGGENEP